MAAAVPKWLESAQGDLTASKTDEQKEKTKTKNRKRYEARKRRIARKREAKMAKLRMAMEEKIDKMQVDTRELIQEEKERSKRFLSLARKYYGMWKTLNEKCRENSVWKLQRSQVQYSKSNVAESKEANFTFPISVTSLTMNERFSDSTTSSTFQIVGETLNISSRV